MSIPMLELNLPRFSKYISLHISPVFAPGSAPLTPPSNPSLASIPSFLCTVLFFSGGDHFFQVTQMANESNFASFFLLLFI